MKGAHSATLNSEWGGAFRRSAKEGGDDLINLALKWEGGGGGGERGGVDKRYGTKRDAGDQRKKIRGKDNLYLAPDQFWAKPKLQEESQSRVYLTKGRRAVVGGGYTMLYSVTEYSIVKRTRYL
jgi:hypothetical protein